jgi:hypothetical protein
VIVTVHQPNYLPYLGFFDKINRADIFVIYDDAQFNKGDYHHRNKIRIHHGWKWLTVPVEKKHIPIKDIKINKKSTNKKQLWGEYHFHEIENNYQKAPYFKKYRDEFQKIYENEYDYLIELNIDIIKLLMNAFNINCKLVFSSELGLHSKSTDRLVEITEILNGDVYLSGSSGKDYLDETIFENKRIRIEYQKFNHPVYSQQYHNFVPNMSSIDFLFNVGNFLRR